MENKHSAEWRISAELAKQNKRLTTAFIIVVIMWIITIISWAVSDNIINNEAIDCAQAHEVQDICGNFSQMSGMNSSETVISPMQSEK